MGAEFLHAGRQTDRHDDANSRFSQFCERANKGEQLGDFCILFYDVPGDANDTGPASAGDVNNSASSQYQSFSRLTTILRVNLQF